MTAARRPLRPQPSPCPRWCENGDAEVHDLWEGAHHVGREVPLARYPDRNHAGQQGYFEAMLIQEAGEDIPSVVIGLPPSARAHAEMRLTVAEATEIAAALTELCRAAGPRRPISYLQSVPARQESE